MIELEEENESKVDLRTCKEKIHEVIMRNFIIKRKDLAEKLGILPRNLNRDINKLIDDGEIIKDKQGREIVYMAVQQKSSIIEEPKESEVLEVLRKTKPTRADQLFDVIKSEERWFSCKELCELDGISSHNFGQCMKPNLQLGKVVRDKVGRETFYRLADTDPVRKVVQLSASELLVGRIEPLKAFLHFEKYTKHHSQLTIDVYKREILLFYNWKNKFNTTSFTVYPCERITLRDIDRFHQYLDEERHYGSAGKRGSFIALKSYFKFLASRNYISHNFMAEEKAPPIEKRAQVIISLEEFWRLVTVAVNGKHPTRDLTLLLVMLDTGARVGEVETICREDLNFDENILVIHGEKAKGVKGRRKGRTLPISNLTAQYLHAVIEENKEIVTPVYIWIQKEREEVGTAVFLNRDRTFLRRHQIGNALISLRTRARLENAVTVHSFRRWLILYLTNNDMRTDFVALRVGHTPGNKMTVDYIEMAPEYREKYDQQYQSTHCLNQADFIAKFNAIVAP